MNKALLNDAGVIDSNNNSDGLDKVQPISNATLEEEEEFFDAVEEQEPVSSIEEGGDLGLATSEEEESIYDLEEREEFFDSKATAFNVPLSIFHYKGYDSDFFTFWYNVSSEIFKEINRVCPEKRVLNLALSVLMLPYIASAALGLVVYNRFKTNDKTQSSSEENKTKKSEVSESIPKRLAYGVLAAIAIFVNVAVLVALIIPATLALATFYLLNKEFSHSLIAAAKISSGSYQNEHQNIEVSFREIDADKSDIRWDMEIKFPPQFEQLLKDLYEDENGKWFDIIRLEHNTIKLSANIHLKNGLAPLRNEIRSVLAVSIQEFAKTMEELLKLEKKDITYDKLTELLNEFRLKVVNSIDSKLTSHLIQDAYQVAFIQAIKIAQGRRKKDFSLEERLKETLVEQELKSQGKELPSRKDIIKEDLKNAGVEVSKKDDEFPADEAEWKLLIEEGKITKRTTIDIYSDKYPQETEEVLPKAKTMIDDLGKMGEKRCRKICKGLEETHKNRRNNNLKDGALNRKLEDLFKFEYKEEEVERRLIDSRIRTIRALLSKSDHKVKQSLIEELDKLEQKQTSTSDEVNDFIKKVCLRVKQYEVQKLLQSQKEGILCLCKKLKRYGESDLAETIEAFRKQDQGHLEGPTLEQMLKDQNERLKAKLNDRGKGHPGTKSIEVLLKRNEEILEALEQLELKKEGLLINKETKNNYREELESRERIKFAIIEDKLLGIIKASSKDELLKIIEKTFYKDELLEIKKDGPLETIRQEAIKKLLERAELEYCLAEKCVKYPVIKTKDDIKHFCGDLLSPLINRLVDLIINNVPKDNQNIAQKAWNSLWIGLGYIRVGLSAIVINKNGNVEGKALDLAHDTYKEVEIFLQYLESNFEEVGGLIGDVFSDDGKTFKDCVWPEIKNHLLGMWDRFFKDIEFTLVSGISQEAVGTKLDGTVTQKHGKFLVAGA
ncbi:MAG: hypothetical protein ACR5K9_04065 [Wolbachia sp.]